MRSRLFRMKTGPFSICSNGQTFARHLSSRFLSSQHCQRGFSLSVIYITVQNTGDGWGTTPTYHSLKIEKDECRAQAYDISCLRKSGRQKHNVFAEEVTRDQGEYD